MESVPDYRRASSHHRAANLDTIVIVANGGDSIVAPARAAAIQCAVLGQLHQLKPRCLR